MRHTRLYRDGRLEAKDFPAAQISDYLQEPGTIVWLDVCEPDPADLEAYFQDVYDHVLRATEWTESLRDLVSTILETNLTIQGNRLNTITKKVTSWAAIIAVPTAVTGFYGMNVPYPGFGRPSGAVTSTLLIVLLSGGLYLLFKRLDWL
jgi:magnesium transporter